MSDIYRGRTFDLDALRDIVAKATAPQTPSFYREMYGDKISGTRLKTREDWHALPCITKEDVQAKSVGERMFCDLKDVDAFYISSGTAGKPPLFTPRGMLQGYEYRKEWYEPDGAFLSGVGPPHRAAHLFKGGEPMRVITLDPNNLRASCKIAAGEGVTGMFIPVFLAAQVAEIFQEHHAGAGVRYIELTGEKIPASLVGTLTKIFPDASVYASWGMSEFDASPMGIPCGPLGENTGVVYHLQSTCHMDLIDPETLAPLTFATGQEGEAVITSYPPSAVFPMIRYRTGDIARITETACPRHGAPTFSIVGRAAVDFLKIPGGVLRVDEIERALKTIGGISPERFQLHRYEEAGPAGMRYRIVLYVDAPDHRDLALLARTIALHLRVGPSLTLAEAAAEGRCAPLECARFESLPPRSKTLRMIAHG